MENNYQYANNNQGYYSSNVYSNYYQNENSEQNNYNNAYNNYSPQYSSQQAYCYNPNVYTPAYEAEESPKASGVCVASLICSLVAFIFNPLSLLHIVGIVLGIVGCATSGNRPKGMAIAGIILGCICILWQGIIDIILSVFTFGLSFIF